MNETALEANPKIDQFWLSYIDALIKEKQFYNAKDMLEQAKKYGVSGEKINTLESQLGSKTQTINSEKPSQQQLTKLLECYHTGRYGDAERLAVSITLEFSEHQFAWKVLGAVLKQTGRVTASLVPSQKSVKLAPQDAEAQNNLGNTLKELGRLDEAEASYRQAILLKPDYVEAHSNLSNTLQELGRLEEAEVSSRQAIGLKPEYAEAHCNLGITLKKLGRLDESLASYTQAIAAKPDFPEAHFNLGVTLQELGRLDETEASYRQAIVLKPDFAEAYSNLGITLKDLGRLDEAETHCRQAIVLKSEHAEAQSNLGVTLQALGRLDEAEASYAQAIVLKPDLAEAHSRLGIIFAIKEDYDSALNSMGRANNIAPMNQKFIVLKSILKSRQSHKQHGTGVCGRDGSIFDMKLNSNPLILQRPVEPELIANLYDINTRKLDETPDTRFGNGKTTNYFLFEDNQFIMDTVVEDLMDIMKEAVESNVVIYESFFNIFRAGSGINIHNHLSNFDKNQGFNLSKQKYVLQYYLRVGDQNCSEPGIYKLYEPDEEILPSAGTIIIIPAERMHSAVYGGDEDRIMIGINFYAL